MRLPRSLIPFAVASATLGLFIGCSGAPDGGLDAPGGSGAKGSDDASGGTGGDANVGSDATSHGDGGGGVPGTCATDADCGAGKMCGFEVTEACSATGKCFDAPPPNTPHCEAYEAGCTCAGALINLACDGYPSGYAPQPVAHTGACDTTVDAGPTACTTDSDCASGDLCEFKIADACAAVGVCITPPPPGPTCAAYSAACTCDHQNINVVCTRYQSGYASSPVAYRGACEGGEADDAGGGSFACGTSSCGNTQVCKTTAGGAYPSKTTMACIDYPTQCASTHTCACVKQALSASTCTESKGNVTVNFLYP